MSMSLVMTKAFFDSKSFKYQADEERNLITTGFGGLKNKGSIKIMLFFDEDDHVVALRSFEFCAFPEAKKAEMYKACSELNYKYRWVKFYVDDAENQITIADDAVIQLDSCGEEIFELMCRLADIADEAYPYLMKAIWQ